LLCAGTLHCGAYDQLAKTEAAPLLFRRIAFSDQHIAIGQDVQPARVIETGGEGLDPQALRRRRRRQPFASAMRIVGISVDRGFGSVGFGP
jgi:hypothetical protein